MDCKKKSVWDSSSTSHIALSDRTLTALNVIATNKKISKSKVVQLLLLESVTLTKVLEELTGLGVFDETGDFCTDIRNKIDSMK